MRRGKNVSQLTMAGLDPATQKISHGSRVPFIALADASALGGRVKPGHGEVWWIAMIIGLGNDLIDIRRIEKSILRFGDRFLERIFTDVERGEVGQAGPARGLLRQALRRQGGLRQGARHRAETRRLLARHGGW